MIVMVRTVCKFGMVLVVTLHHTFHRPHRRTLYMSHIVRVNCLTQRSYTPSHTTSSHLPVSPQSKDLESSLKASLAQWSTLLDHASLFQQWLERAECEVDREYAGSTLEEAQAFFSIVMVRVAVCMCEGQRSV